MGKEYNLFLDDERFPEHVTWVDIGPGPWVIVRTQKEFEEIIQAAGIPAKISFDNDLGDGCGEGIFAAHWLVNAILDGDITYRPFEFHVHSKNHVAGENIQKLLHPFIKHMEQMEKTSCVKKVIILG